jgi:HSP20 family protein
MTSVVFNPKVSMNKSVFTPPAFDKLVNEFINSDWPQFGAGGVNAVSRPAVNILESDADYRIEVAAPGLEKSDFKVSINKDILSISTEKPAPAEENGKVLRREFSFLNFQRGFRLPNIVDVTGIQAAYNNGVLTVTLPKREEARVKPPREIEIA